MFVAAAAFVSPTPFPSSSRSSLSTLKCRPSRHPHRTASRITRAVVADETRNETETGGKTGEKTTRMFSNVRPDAEGNLQRLPPSEIGCTALIAGTMVGAGVLALPTVAAPSGFLPSSAALIGIWLYMAATGLLISEVTINTACALGRPNGISILSLSRVTLGTGGAVVTALSYALLHYAILTAYVSQGGSQLLNLVNTLSTTLHADIHASSHLLAGLLFSGTIGGGMYILSPKRIESINNGLVLGVIAAFVAVIAGDSAHVEVSKLAISHWSSLLHGELIPVLFVSCVYHNVISTISMRLEGDRGKIRRAILCGSGLPVAMFIAYNAATLGTNGGTEAQLAVEVFSLLAVATSFVGFVEGLTEVWRDVRESSGVSKEGSKAWIDFVATLAPPVVFASLWNDVFVKALDAAGTYGIAVLFGGVPAVMAWRNRGREGTREFERSVVGGDLVLAGVGVVPVLLIVSRIWESFAGGG